MRWQLSCPGIEESMDKNIGQKLLGLQTYASKWNLMFTIAAQKQRFYVNRLLRLQSTMFLAFA